MDDQHISEVFARSYPRLVTQLTALSGNILEAEDLVQEAFVTALAKAPDFELVATKEAWLRTVALNRLRRRWRRDSVMQRLLPRLVRDPGRDDAALPADHVAVVAALRQLAPHAREVVVLHYLADLSVAQMAAELEVPQGTVKARLARARTALGPLLDDRDHTIGNEPDHV